VLAAAPAWNYLEGVARLDARIADNVPGRFFVDDSCIDCDACRQLAPSVFARSDRQGQSFVAAQPDEPGTVARALMALVACPTASIGATPKLDLAAAVAAFPERVDGNVYYLGFHSPDSYGAASYLIVRSEGNVVVDSPRAARPLLARLALLGGVRTMFLSHRDDVADHAVFARRFGCERVLHAADGGRALAVERCLDGDAPIALAADLVAIPVPGHTRGSMALLHRDVLFTGDHLWWDNELGRLDAGRDVCWYSWPEQLRSLSRLRDYDFRWVLPGHGRRFAASSTTAMRRELERMLAALGA
jgi:glyoxylase-like metal-dependent hydrolase (beta-lactamase superfamily II)/ferredoxin